MISFRTFSGKLVDLEWPRPENVCLADISVGLAFICRFTGQVPSFYSVAQHSLIVAALVPPQLRLAALLHDASEAYLNDISRNLKHSPMMEGYRIIERRWRDAIEQYFRIELTDADRLVIKVADDLTAIYERCILRNGQPWVQEHILDSYNDGWVKSDPTLMLAMARRYEREHDGHPEFPEVDPRVVRGRFYLMVKEHGGWV